MDPDDKEARRKREPQAVADVLGGVLAAMQLDLAAPVAAIGENWEAIVGREVAEHCRPVGIKAGVLHADVDSSVWCQQLHLRSPEILSALKDFLGSTAPTALRFRVGNSWRASPPDAVGAGRIE
ncbi:MAG: DUF721 domain-containing protein [Myxococcales bacterium]|nr:DUF721 domain-containing protein [Myxococcales bacterium]